jgi:membrane-bound lytic murein transglycosylase
MANVRVRRENLYKLQLISFKKQIVNHILHPAFEDEPDRGFRNVGKTQSDAGEIPKRTYSIQNIAKVWNQELLLLFTAIDLSLGGISPSTGTDRTNKNKYTYINEPVQKHSTNSTKHSKYKYTYYQNTTQLSKHQHITKPTHSHTHTLQNKLKWP